MQFASVSVPSLDAVTYSTEFVIASPNTKLVGQLIDILILDTLPGCKLTKSKINPFEF